MTLRCWHLKCHKSQTAAQLFKRDTPWYTKFPRQLISPISLPPRFEECVKYIHWRWQFDHARSHWQLDIWWYSDGMELKFYGDNIETKMVNIPVRPTDAVHQCCGWIEMLNMSCWGAIWHHAAWLFQRSLFSFHCFLLRSTNIKVCKCRTPYYSIRSVKRINDQWAESKHRQDPEQYHIYDHESILLDPAVMV